MALLPTLRRRREPPLETTDLLTKAITVAQTPATLMELPPEQRRRVDLMAKAITNGSTWGKPGQNSGTLAQLRHMRPVGANVVAQRAAESIGPDHSNNITPIEIESALRNQGLDWVAPFAPGRPLTPFYGYNQRPRERDYPVGRNITTERRPGRIPFETLRHLIESYDVASICYRHAIQDLRSMRVRFEVMEGYEENAVKEIAAAKDFMKRPDRKIDPESGKVIPNTGMTFRNWLCKHATDVWRFDCGSMYRHRDRAGRLIALPIPDGTLFAPMLDYFGTNPSGDAPAFQQFIQGIPWDWIRWEDLIYEPMWPHTEDPYGIAPVETILVNANTDLRLQAYFLQFFTTGQVPEAFAIAPEDQSDPDSLADWQEEYNDWTYGDQSERWGLRWLPNGTELEFYKPQQFDPDVAEYVMRRTVAAFMMVPHDLGFTADVNRSTADTQMDTQFRINSLPHVAYYEDILDSVLQDDLSLPVQIRFDTGREKEDRLMEAEAHQIYVSIGAESPDEVRDKVLGHAVNPEEKVPRFFDSTRLGPIPISYLLATAGDVDPLTGAPRPGTVQRRDIVLPGTPGPDPLSAPPSAQYDSAQEHDAAAGRSVARGGGAGPKVSAPAPVPPLLQPAAPIRGRKPAASNGPTPQRPVAPAGRSRVDQGTASRRTLKEELGRWRTQSRKRVAKGLSPRAFESQVIPDGLYKAIWSVLERAENRPAVDNAFARADLTEHESDAASRDAATAPGPPFAGLCLRAADTGRVLMIQRALVEGDPLGGYFEFPGGHVDPSETPREAALREWGEETGCKFPASAHPTSEWNSTNGRYRGHVYEIDSEGDVDFWDRTEVTDPDNEDQDYFEAIAWHDPAHISNNPSIRPELAADSQITQDAIARKGASGPVAALAVVAADSGRVLMVQRGNKDDGGGARFEFPMGHIDAGEKLIDGAIREWQEETGAKLPKDAEQVGTFVADDFHGFVFRIPDEGGIELGTPNGDEISAISWWDIDDLDDSDVRDKVRESLDESEPLLEQAEKGDYAAQLDRWVRGRGPEPAGGVPVVPKDLRPGPGGHREAELVEHHTPLIQRALGQMVDAHQAAERFATTGALEADVAKGRLRDAIDAVAKTLHITVEAIKDAIESAWADSWLAGAKDGLDSLDEEGVWVPDEDTLDQAVAHTDWGKWAPGQAPPAADLSGFDAVAPRLGQLIVGISNTTRNQIATQVEQFVGSRVGPVPWGPGDVAALAAEIDSVLNDADRALLIALTEVNRAMTEASAELFQRARIAMFDLLTHPSACPRCVDIREHNPHPLSDTSALPPIHPRCRCSIRPVRGPA